MHTLIIIAGLVLFLAADGYLMILMRRRERRGEYGFPRSRRLYK